MKYICLAFINDEGLAERSLKTRNERFADDGGIVVRQEKDKVSITDGPFAETKELVCSGCVT